MHVNTGNSEQERGSNCALCTAGGLTGQSAGDVNADLQSSVPPANRWGPEETDDAFVQYMTHYPTAAARRIALGREHRSVQPVADQMVGLAIYVASRTGTAASFIGDPIARPRWRDTRAKMQARPAGTRFAVFTSSGDDIFGLNAHWITARWDGEALTFTDYQTDTQSPAGTPTVSAHPLGPDGEAYVDATDNVKLDTYVLAVAFS
jgi:hypothetical protein